MLELCRNPQTYRSLILSLTSLYREELAFIESVKRLFPQIEIWLTQTDGRQAALAESMRLGADGLLAEDGLHRIALTLAPEATTQMPASTVLRSNESNAGDERAHPNDDAGVDADLAIGEPVLTADELRALLQEQPSLPPSGE